MTLFYLVVKHDKKATVVVTILVPNVNVDNKTMQYVDPRYGALLRCVGLIGSLISRVCQRSTTARMLTL